MGNKWAVQMLKKMGSKYPLTLDERLVVDTAADALGFREPKEAVVHHFGDNHARAFFWYPACSHVIDQGDSYCRTCGQAIKQAAEEQA